jgi:hypothetical protein
MKKERNISMTTHSDSLETSIKVLKETIQWFKTQIEPHDCGWMHTTISGLNHRIKILKNEIKKNRPKETWIEGYNKWKNERCPHN